MILSRKLFFKISLFVVVVVILQLRCYWQEATVLHSFNSYTVSALNVHAYKSTKHGDFLITSHIGDTFMSWRVAEASEPAGLLKAHCDSNDLVIGSDVFEEKDCFILYFRSGKIHVYSIPELSIACIIENEENSEKVVYRHLSGEYLVTVKKCGGVFRSNIQNDSSSCFILGHETRIGSLLDVVNKKAILINSIRVSAYETQIVVSLDRYVVGFDLNGAGVLFVKTFDCVVSTVLHFRKDIIVLCKDCTIYTFDGVEFAIKEKANLDIEVIHAVYVNSDMIYFGGESKSHAKIVIIGDGKCLEIYSNAHYAVSGLSASPSNRLYISFFTERIIFPPPSIYYLNLPE